jgi:hypothetical protein
MNASLLAATLFVAGNGPAVGGTADPIPPTASAPAAAEAGQLYCIGGFRWGVGWRDEEGNCLEMYSSFAGGTVEIVRRCAVWDTENERWVVIRGTRTGVAYQAYLGNGFAAGLEASVSTSPSGGRPRESMACIEWYPVEGVGVWLGYESWSGPTIGWKVYRLY